MHDAERLLGDLNPPQREAVTHGEGPLLILAGAGTGKTRVITHRIAWLVEAAGAPPHEIVAVTFTNKAAQEMKDRAERLLGDELTGAFVGTFHAFCLRVLRAHTRVAGLAPDFVIYDTADQQAVVRQVLREMATPETTISPRQTLAAISRRKNALVAPGTLADDEPAAGRAPFWARAHELYDAALRRAGAVDFDDLLVEAVRLLRDNPDVREKLARRIRWLLVDEYQDTNPPQYALIRLLAEGPRNVSCVGDEDQSIYGFRGADIRNILNFTHDFSDARVIKLEQNYRSTGAILGVASSLIRHNRRRRDKTLWTASGQGESILVHLAADDRGEADFVVGELLRRSREAGAPLDELAVLYRTNASSRLIEDRLVAAGIPYRVLGSLRFYDRKEIKDLIAWLRLLVHPDSDQDFLRAAGFPPRGLGERTLEQLGQVAARAGDSLFRAARRACAEPAPPGRAARVLTPMLTQVDELTHFAERSTTVAAVQAVIDALDYFQQLEKAHPLDHASRAENVGALLAAAREHDEAGAVDHLAGFLDRVSLRSDSDDVRGERGPTLLTVHSAKGLEFTGVVVAGLNEGLFPHALSTGDLEEVEEERRLMYVAITRARRFVTLTLSRERRPFGAPVDAAPSRFLAELPPELLHLSQDPLAADWGARRFRGARRTRTAATPAAGVTPGGGERRVERDVDGAEAAEFAPGQWVVHPMFGKGRIVAAEGSGAHLKLKIRFERAGVRKIMAHATTLTLVERDF